MKLKKLNENEKIKKLEEKKQKLLVQLNREKNKIKEQNRKTDTRQKILLGAFIKKILNEHQVINFDNFHIEFEKFLSKDRDKELFDFSNKEKFEESIKYAS